MAGIVYCTGCGMGGILHSSTGGIMIQSYPEHQQLKSHDVSGQTKPMHFFSKLTFRSSQLILKPQDPITAHAKIPTV